MNMGNLNKLALTAQEALQQTIVIASENESSQAEPIHMLKALLESKENNLSAIIKRIGAEPFQLQANVDAEIQRMPKVSGNPGMMSGVPGPALMNLIDNAVKFGPRGGLIRMRLIEEDGSVLFTIDNEGKSIPDEDKSRIFNKFYQGDSSHESEGNGLGLALVRKIVAIHGGEVWVEDPVNGGCRFAVRLPTEK